MTDVLGAILSPLLAILRWLLAHAAKVLGMSDEPLLKIHILHAAWERGELDVVSLVVENVGQARAGATRPARAVRVRCRVDEHGPFDLYWAEPEPVLAMDLLEDEDKSVDVAFRWSGPGPYHVREAQLDPGVTYLVDPVLLQHGVAGQPLEPGARRLEVTCHYDETGRARARLVLQVPAVGENVALQLEEGWG